MSSTTSTRGARAPADLTVATGVPAHLPRRADGLSRRRTGGRRIGSHVFLVILAIYFITPLWWLIVAATKSNSGLFTGTGGALWFDDQFALSTTSPGSSRTRAASTGAGSRTRSSTPSQAGAGATILAILAGYGFAKYRFRGRGPFFTVVLASVMVPLTALVIPTFMLLSQMGLINTRGR